MIITAANPILNSLSSDNRFTRIRKIFIGQVKEETIMKYIVVLLICIEALVAQESLDMLGKRQQDTLSIITLDKMNNPISYLSSPNWCYCEGTKRISEEDFLTKCGLPKEAEQSRQWHAGRWEPLLLGCIVLAAPILNVASLGVGDSKPFVDINQYTMPLHIMAIAIGTSSIIRFSPHSSNDLTFKRAKEIAGKYNRKTDDK